MTQFLKLSFGFFIFCVVLVGFIWMFAPRSLQPVVNRTSAANATNLHSAVSASHEEHRSDKPAQDDQHNGH